jgi:hypothetical protein
MSKEPKIVISSYGSQGAPDAATFDKGATTPADFQRAVDAPREQAEQITPGDLAKRHI